MLVKVIYRPNSKKTAKKIDKIFFFKFRKVIKTFHIFSVFINFVFVGEMMIISGTTTTIQLFFKANLFISIYVRTKRILIITFGNVMKFFLLNN